MPHNTPPLAVYDVGATCRRIELSDGVPAQVYRIDVGMSKGCGDGDVQVLEILGDTEVRRLGWDANGKPKVLAAEDAWSLKAFLGAVRGAVGTGSVA